MDDRKGKRNIVYNDLSTWNWLNPHGLSIESPVVLLKNVVFSLSKICELKYNNEEIKQSCH